MMEECLNFLFILSLENDIARKLSYDQTVHEYVARKNRKKECKMCFMWYVFS